MMKLFDLWNDLTQLHKSRVHNREDVSSFDFISAVLTYKLFHIHIKAFVTKAK